MSRLAKKTIHVPSGVTVSIAEGVVAIRGSKGAMTLPILPHVFVAEQGGEVSVTTKDSFAQSRMNAGTMWSLVRNALVGVSGGYTKTLEIEGIGYRAVMEGTTLVLSLGYVNPVRYQIPEGIVVAVDKAGIKVSGYDKELVGRTASQIRAFKKPEPYKGKGIRYQGEVIRRKVGKKAATTGT